MDAVQDPTGEPPVPLPLRDGRGPDTVPARVTRHFDDNVREILYGAVLAAAAMTVVSAQPTTSDTIALSIVLMLVVYSLAHLYAEVLGSRMQQPGASVWQRVRAGAGHELAVLEGGLPVLVCYLTLRAGGVGVADAAFAASWFTVGLMAFVGYRIGRVTRATGLRLALEAGGAAAIGVLLIVLKTAL